jgi:Single-strand binding protein family
MTEAAVSFAGNLTDDPEVRYTEGGIARAMFRVAVSGRREQEASLFTVVVSWDQAEHAAESLSKGSRVVVVGQLQLDREDGDAEFWAASGGFGYLRQAAHGLESQGRARAGGSLRRGRQRCGAACGRVDYWVRQP